MLSMRDSMTQIDWKLKNEKNIFHAHSNQKKTGVAILIEDKIDFKSKKLPRDREKHYMLIKVSIQQEI